MSTSAPPAGLAPADIITLEDGCVRLLDQTLLPGEIVTRRCTTWPEVVEAIATLAVRGAPAIGIAGAMGVALAAQTGPHDLDALRDEIRTAGAALRAARPTAVNLMWAVDRVLAIADAHPGPREALVARLVDEARTIHADEVRRCTQMGTNALPLLHRGARILTHCNAGALATGGYGTALGVVRAAYAADPSVQVIVDETRPLLQGSRLTAWELHQEQIPYTLITDSMAATMMAEGRVTHVVVGADRIAANGDVVNKIGTYGLAVLAREHDIPFIVAAPTTTFDLTLPSAAQVPIEERSPDEVTGIDLFGRATSPDRATVANPAFDRTPHHLVSAIVTEVGLHRPPYESSLRAAFDAAGH